MVFSFNDLPQNKLHLAGGKGSTLASLSQTGYPVPEGFVILPSAFINDKLSPET